MSIQGFHIAVDEVGKCFATGGALGATRQALVEVSGCKNAKKGKISRIAKSAVVGGSRSGAIRTVEITTDTLAKSIASGNVVENGKRIVRDVISTIPENSVKLISGKALHNGMNRAVQKGAKRVTHIYSEAITPKAMMTGVKIAAKNTNKSAMAAIVGGTVKHIPKHAFKTVARSNAISNAARLSVDLGIDTIRLMRGKIDRNEYKHRTMHHAASAGGSFSGAVSGALIGTAICPGLGTSIGSLLGSVIGDLGTGRLMKRLLKK